MKTTRRVRSRVAPVLLAWVLVSWLGGCSSEEHPEKKPAEEPAPGAKPDTGASGAQLWAENCGRCHYNRSPTYYSDAQWEVIGHHMRLRCYLTGEEQRKITEFLKNSN